MAHLNLTENPSEEFFSDKEKKRKVYYLNDETEPLSLFGPIQNVNIFVGANNSGKSRFLRGIIKHPIYSIIDIDFFDSVSESILDDYTVIDHAENLEVNKVFISFIPNQIQAGNHEILMDLKDMFDLEGSGNKNTKINFDKTFFDTIIKEINNWKTKITSMETKEEFSEYLFTIKIQLSSIIDVANSALPNLMNEFIYGNIKISNINRIRNHISRIKNIIDNLEALKEDNLYQFIKKNQRIYIPILRTAASLYNYHNNDENSNVIQKIPSNIFEYAVRKNYNFPKKESKVEIRTGLDLYKSIRLIRNNFRDIRKEFEDFEKFISDNFFNGDSIDIVAKEEEQKDKNEEHIIIHIGKEKRDRNIHDLGDGIQSLIIMMYPIFTAEKDAWIFIEEPEINLHPGLQRIFLEQITTNPAITDKDLKFFITTHSNNLLDLTLEQEENGISIFTFQKETIKDKNIKRIRNVLSGDTDILKLLGVNNSSVFMANCSIWVEGHTDRIYLKAYLKAYIESEIQKDLYKEDLHYSFFEYAGSNLSHYLFIDKDEIDLPEDIEFIQAQFLSNRIFLLADKDNGKEKKHSLLGSQENKNFTYHVLKSREIENLISPKKVRDLIQGFSKGKIKSNSQRITNINSKSLKKNIHLGVFLKDKFKVDLPKIWIGKSKTISPSYKKKIADFITKDLKWGDMTKEAQELTKEVYSFIEKHNK